MVLYSNTSGISVSNVTDHWLQVTGALASVN